MIQDVRQGSSKEAVALYLEYMADQLTRLRNARFSGNIEFKVNFREGHISHINDHLHKSVVIKPKK